VRIERHIWNRDSFVKASEASSRDTAQVRLADKFVASADRYLKGPVPWAWLVAASKLPGKSLAVGLCIWRLSGVMKSRTLVLGNTDLEPLGVDRAGKSRALAALEAAGLISIKRKRGRFPALTIENGRVPQRAAEAMVPGKYRRLRSL
jgi:hypothetical protein